MTAPQSPRRRRQRGSGEARRRHVATKLSGEEEVALKRWAEAHGLTLGEAVREAIVRLTRQP